MKNGRFIDCFHHKDTPRRRYIRILRERVGAVESLSEDDRRHVLQADLISDGYLSGATAHDANGFPSGNVIVGVTLKGRLFLQDLEEKEREQSIIGRLNRAGDLGMGLVLGVAGTIAGAIILHVLQLK